jgi:hypothetical protein
MRDGSSSKRDDEDDYALTSKEGKGKGRNSIQNLSLKSRS